MIHVYNNDYFQYVVCDIYSLLVTVLKVSVKEDIGNEFSVIVCLYGPMLYSRLVEPSRHGTDKATSRD